jgi:Fe/S biogenesis protein NfuA
VLSGAISIRPDFDRSETTVATLDPAMSTSVETPVLTVTDDALETIVGLKAAEEDGATLALRVEITGARGSDYTYDLAFEPLGEAAEGDAVYQQGDLSVWIPADSIDNLMGATLDLPGIPGQGGLVLRNPNRPDPFGGASPFDTGSLELTGDTAEKIRQLLDQQVNPALASHGGYATLIGVDGEKAIVEMGGGCQGCAVSAMTLRDGIERAIKENVPEITEVVDATDHGAGENPYY